MVGVARFFTGLARLPQDFNRPPIISPQIMEISNVVLGLRHRQRQVLFLCEPPGLFIGAQGAFVVIQHDQAYRHVVKDSNDGFCIFAGKQLGTGPLVALQGFAEAVLAMKDVSYVDFQACQANIVAGASEDLSRPLRRRMCPLIFAQQDQRLD